MSTQFILSRDINGYNGFGLMFADDKYSVELDAGVAATFTIPSSHPNWIVIFSFETGSDIWVASNAAAEVPAGNTIVATTSEHNPVARKVKAGDVLSLITSDTTAVVGITLYTVSYNM